MTRTPPAHPATARGLITDLHGHWLIVRPTGDHRWHLPGGLIEQNESPAAACRREVREELGLDLEPGPLHALGWNPPVRPGRSARFTFIFAMGTHDAAALAARIHLRESELDAWQWSRPDQALGMLHPDLAERLTTARATVPSAVYVESPEPGDH
ncbi:NUDIX domain-containing protein [Pseudonocardia acaciae]|uniref:NUDIX domain-containing protein n=1 Tax=Pseudonocardia acaciae TaxID=551276 RepID=UPI000561BB87|nr:NUDIX hydrolase [Pseudonocardia acaciae]